MKLDVLAIGAHPDDVELSSGGTVVKLVKQGRKVGLVDITRGELGTRGSGEIREKEAADAARALGVEVRTNLGMPDGDIVNNAENRAKLIKVIRRHRPDILLIPYSVDRHPDHENTNVLCREAWFHSGLTRIETEDKGKPQTAFRPRAYYCFMQWFEFTPSFIVDISDEIEARMEAARAFKSQFYDPESKDPDTSLSDPRFLEWVKTRLAYYGSKIGVEYGEPFFSPHPIRIDDLWLLNK
jgi:bacillithiol biosynthesis deacetylase BshB1